MASPTLIGTPAIQLPGKLLRIVTRCATVDEFVATFARFVDDTSIFVVMKTPRPVGPPQPFSMRLADGTPVLQGEAEVIESRPEGGEGRPGIRVKLRELDDASKALHLRLREAGDAAAASQSVERASTQGGDYGTVEESGLRFPPGALTVESLTPPAEPAPPAPLAATAPTVTAPLVPAPPILPPPKSLPPPGPRSSALPPPMPPAPQSVPVVPTMRGPEIPPPPPAPLPPVPIPQPPILPVTTPLVPLAQMRPPNSDSLPLPAPPEAAPFAPGRSPTATGGQPTTRRQQRPSTGVNSGIERAWQESEPRIDDPYGDANDDRRKLLIVGGVTGGAGLLVGLLLGYLFFSGGKTPANAQASAPSAAAAPAGDPAGAPSDPPPSPAADDPGTADPGGAPLAAGGGCKATIHSTPPGADVSIGKTAAGQTPLDDLDIDCGELTITLTRPRYETITRTVTARADEPVTLDERLVRPTAMLELVSVPPGATFSVDGVRSQGKLRVESFTNRTITAQMPGYKTQTKKVYVRGTKMRVQFKLDKGTGKATPKKTPPKKGR